MAAKRLDTGGRIDRSKRLHFTWDGRVMSGYSGDTLASALLANNEYVLGRSFKYHRPRGIMSAGTEESGAIVTIGSDARRDPNAKATTQELYDGLVATGQNAWPNVRFDMGEMNNLFGRFFVAGFYYKTFMGLSLFKLGGGTRFWMWCEKIIRKAAGMGEVSRDPDPDQYEHANAYCDVLVVGSGPAGLAAATRAAEAGLEVTLVEQDSELGGTYLSEPDDTPRIAAIEAARTAGVNLMIRTTAFGLYDNCVVGLLEWVTDHLATPSRYQPRHRLWVLRAKYIIVAAGALERGLAFGNNDRPGIMTVSAGRTYLNRFGVLPGERIVVATNNDSAYQTAAELSQAGATVTLLEARSAVPGAVSNIATEHGVGIRFATVPLEAKGRKSIKAVETAVADGTSWHADTDELCDALLVSSGWSPIVNLLSHRGVRPQWDADNACFLPADCKEPITMAGSAVGVWNHQQCIISGEAAAATAIKALNKDQGKDQGKSIRNPKPGGWTEAIKPLYEIRVPRRKLKSFVDPQHDVTTEDVRLAHREGYVSVEHLKRYTTLGMATDQGKIGNIIGLALMAEALGKDIPEVGTTTFRPPYTPVSIGALRGRSVGAHFRPLRRTPMHDWNLQHGATMMEAGLWQRPWYFAKPGEGITEAYIRETETVRQSVGLCDVTSLGKIAVQGPDAAKLLNRVYTNAFAKLAVGKARYGIMLRDDGLVVDDGTTWRLDENEFFMTTTTAHAAATMVWLEELLQTRWQDLRVHLTSVSEQWGGLAVAGPKSREVLQECIVDPDKVSNEALPFMGVIETELKGGIPCRIARISFSGEMAYEVYFESDYAVAANTLLWESAQAKDGCLYGTEALGALRVEKGHVTHAELDGRVTIDDAGLGKMASSKKAYIGNVLRQRPALTQEDRPQLVGIFPKNREETFNAGAIICAADDISGLGEGWITSVTHSPEMGHWCGIGFVKGGLEQWQGKELVAADPVRKGNIDIELVSPHMLDPSGERMHG